MAEDFVNDFDTTLDGAINDSVTSLVVIDSPPTGLTPNFRIRIDDEILLVTAIGGTGNKTWTVIREAEEATRFPKTAHSNGVPVTHVLTAAGLLTAIAEGGAGISGFSGAGAYNSTDLAFNTGAETALTMDTDAWDTDGFHDTGSNTSRLTIPTGKAGYYLWTVDVRTTANVGAYIAVRKNAGTILGITSTTVNNTPGVRALAVSGVAFLADADYIEMYGLADSAVSADAPVGGPTPWFSITRIGAAITPVMSNEVRNFPSLENADNAQPEWWEESAGTATLTEVDLAGEGITESWERALKVVTTADVHALQTYTYADEKRLKSGKTISARVAVWAVSGVTARVRLQSTVGSLGVATTTAAAWTILTVEGVVLDGTAVDLRLEVNNGTAYFVPLAFGVGSSAPNELPPRDLAFRWRDPTSVKSLTGIGDEATWTDIDCTSASSPLAAIAVGTLFIFEAVSSFHLYVRRNGSSAAADNAARRAFADAATQFSTSEYTIILDDQQIFEYYLDRTAGSSTLDDGAFYLTGWWEWA